MSRCAQHARHLHRWLLAPTLLLALLACCGCRTFSYYTQAIRGQYEILGKQRSIARLVADPKTPPPLREKLQLVTSLRAFAAQELRLPVDGHYEKYADLHRRFVVWNVEAAPEFSLEAKTWWYPFIGSLKYRGYFTREAAVNYAATLQKQGYDVYLGGVTAYSTLGWFKDPVLNTFLYDPEAELAETLFHELGHQRVFVGGDTDFNEAFATAVGQEGARRWLRAKGDEAGLNDYLAQVRRTMQFAHLVKQTRKRLQILYGDEPNANGKLTAAKTPPASSPEQLWRRKQDLLDDMKQEYQALKTQWGGISEYDPWFARPLNNAQLNSVASYYDLVPGFEKLLAENGGDLEQFYQAVETLSHEPKAERHRLLAGLAAQAIASAKTTR